MEKGLRKRYDSQSDIDYT